MSTIIAKNNTGADIFIQDLGITIPASSSIELTQIFSIIRIYESNNLNDEVTNGNITINDGTYDLPSIESLDHLTIQTEYEDIYYGESGWSTSSKPPDDPVNGKGFYDSTASILYIYDESRAKWLSSNREFLRFQKTGTAENQYLNLGNLSLSLNGYLVPRKGTITSLSILATGGDSTSTIEIQNNSVLIIEKQLQNDFELVDFELNVDFNNTTLLQCYCEGELENTIVMIELAWRY